MTKCEKCGMETHLDDVGCMRCDPYLADAFTGLRAGQIETHYIDPEKVPEDPDLYCRDFYYYSKERSDHWDELFNVPNEGFYVLMKLYYQTDEEAGGTGADRKCMLDHMKGDSYWYNGEKDEYERVACCEQPDREYAMRTILIRGQTDVLILKGDWDYNVITEHFPPQRWQQKPMIIEPEPLFATGVSDNNMSKEKA